MKRDMAIIREILLLCEGAHANFDLANTCTTQEERDIYAYHVQLLEDGGYVVARICHEANGHAIAINVERMTWTGTELLENLRNESVFKITMKRLTQSVGAFSLPLVQSIAAEELRKLISMP